MAHDTVVEGTFSRPDQHGWLENEESLRHLTGMDGRWIAGAIHSCYETLDIIDEQLTQKGTSPLSQLVELANLSAIVGNLLGAGLAEASNGVYVRNRPHAYPDLVPVRDGHPPAEIKVALEQNSPKGHLPKAGLHVIFRYVLGDRAGRFARGAENRGDTVWIWEARLGVLSAEDFSVSNTEGDSGKTAVIKTSSFKGMVRVFYVPEFLPYARRRGWYGDDGADRPLDG